jgi:hypothetical protein
MKKRAPAKPAEEDPKLEYPDRLAELEAELRTYPARTSDAPPSAIPSVTDVKIARLAGEEVVCFKHRGKNYAIGHTDKTFAGTNASRGVRTIRLYDGTNAVVLAIAGDYENHQFGANFRFRTLDTYVAGEWEEAFSAITTGLRTFRADRKEELRKHRQAANGRR